MLDPRVQAIVAARQRVDACRQELDTARLAVMLLAGQLAVAEFRAVAATQAMAESVIALEEIEKRCCDDPQKTARPDAG